MPIGTRLIDSTPAAMTTSICPLITVAAAKWSACWLLPHWRSTLVPGTLSGSLDDRTALRATLPDCCANWLTQPMMTSSTSAGSAPLRSTSAFSTCPARSAGCQPVRRPPRRPPAVRAAATI